MSNPTIYRYPKKIVERNDGTRVEIEKSLRQNKDVSVIVKVKDQMAHTKVVYHLVYDSRGNIVHGPHEEPGSRDSDYREGFPFEDIS
jgi:hypothetical protein